MEDLIFALLSGVAELLIEVIFELASETFTAFIIRSVRNLVGKSKAINPVFAEITYFLLGAVCGVGSVIAFPHPLVHPSRVHGISVVLAPIITGLIMSQIGLMRRRKGRDSVQIESFGYGFTFALGLAVVRFVFVN
jgi:hypothetical protein